MTATYTRVRPVPHRRRGMIATSRNRLFTSTILDHKSVAWAFPLNTSRFSRRETMSKMGRKVRLKIMKCIMKTWRVATPHRRCNYFWRWRQSSIRRRQASSKRPGELLSKINRTPATLQLQLHPSRWIRKEAKKSQVLTSTSKDKDWTVTTWKWRRIPTWQRRPTRCCPLFMIGMHNSMASRTRKLLLGLSSKSNEEEKWKGTEARR